MTRTATNTAGRAAAAARSSRAVVARGLEALAQLCQTTAGRLDPTTEPVETPRAGRVKSRDLQVAQAARLNAMGEMAATLAHELSQPLAAIRNYAAAAQRMVSSNPRDPELPDLLRKVADQSERTARIVARIRQGADRTELSTTPQALPDLFAEVIDVAMADVAKESVVLRYEFDPDAGLVLVDRVQVQQVVLNLLRNALEAMADSGWRELRIGAAAEGAEHVRVHVIDSGTGVPRDLADRLFEPFVTDKVNGMGVGLSISRTIVEAHGGQIWVQRAAGGGAAFYFTLRRAPSPRTNPQTSAATRARPSLRPATP
ncbi:MAG: sensor histidine kinase [Pseudomonadota bacterium]